jgi:hypothetical protein
MPFRIDKIAIKGRVSRTDEGYLTGIAPITRAGVFTYHGSDGKPYNELRHPDDVFSPDSLETLKMVPITNTHPWFGRVKSDNVKRVQVGMTGESVTTDAPHVMSSIKITDSSAVEDIDSGRQQVSAGYKCQVINETGVFDGIEYTSRQKNIRYNHVALCDAGRAGPDVGLNLDSLDTEDTDIMISDSVEYSQFTGSKNMGKIVLDSCEYEAPQDVINACNRDKLRTDAILAESTAKIASLTKDHDALKGENAALKAKVDSFDKRDFGKEIQEAVKNRRDLETSASIVLPKEVSGKFDSMSDADIRKAVISTKLPDLKLDSQSDAFIDGCYNTVIASAKQEKKAGAIAGQRADSKDRESGRDSRQDGKINSEAAHERYVDEMKNGWKKKK